jgi:predicted Zn-dependent protease
MKDRLFEALKKNSADYTEIRVETLDTATVAYRGKEIEAASVSSFRGGIVRACVRGGWGVVAFDSLDDIAHHVEEACACAALVGNETTQLADADIVDAEFPAVMERDFRGIELDEKIAQISTYNDILLGAGPAIESSMASYSDSWRTVHFASTRGNYFMEERPRIVCALSATARDGSLVQRAHHGISSSTSYDAVVGLDSIALEIGERAQALLKAPLVEGGPQTVILNREMAGVFIHEAFGHFSESDNLYENPDINKLMLLGRKLGPEYLNVVDDGSVGLNGEGKKIAGTIACDDEGTPSSKTYLVKDGILSGHLHSLETAAKMGEAPTGNARAISREFAPIVRMTNTYIENGQQTPEELFAGVDKGLYACDAFGGQTMLEMFTFSAAYGYLIENGQKGELVRNVVLTGNVFDTLNSIDGIANDMVMGQRSGGCGKNGQSPLPCGLSAPHVRIQNVVVGG